MGASLRIKRGLPPDDLREVQRFALPVLLLCVVAALAAVQGSCTGLAKHTDGPAGSASLSDAARTGDAKAASEEPLAPFTCPEGTELRNTVRARRPGSIASVLSGSGGEMWCAERGRLRGGQTEVRHGPYRKFDRDGHWLELGQYVSVHYATNDGDWPVGIWRFRRRGSCGEWVEWSRWSGTPEDHYAPPPPEYQSPEPQPRRAIDCGEGRKSTNISSPDGVSVTCMKGGAKDGPAWVWNEVHALVSEQHYAEGTLDGRYRAWHSNGALHWEGGYRDGMEEGEWREGGCDGAVRCEGTASAGRIVGGWKCSAGEPPPLVGWLDWTREEPRPSTSH